MAWVLYRYYNNYIFNCVIILSFCIFIVTSNNDTKSMYRHVMDVISTGENKDSMQENQNLTKFPSFPNDTLNNIRNVGVTFKSSDNLTVLFQSLYKNRLPLNRNPVSLKKASTVPAFIAEQQSLIKQPHFYSNNKKDNNNYEYSNKISEFVENLILRINNLRNLELGVPYVQGMFDSMNFTTFIENNADVVTKISSRIKNKIQQTIKSINYLHNIILEHTKNNFYINTIIQPCPFDDYNEQNYYNKNQIEIINYLKYGEKNYIKQNNNGNSLDYIINTKITSEFKKLLTNENISLANVFFLSQFDHASDNFCQYYFNNQHYRYLYVSAIQRKHVFLLIDNGNAYNDEQFELTRTFVTNIIQLLTYDDHLTVVLVSDIATPVRLEGDDNETSFKYPCTIDNRNEFIDFFNYKLNYSKTSATNHVIGFEYSFHLLQKCVHSKDSPVEFLYITRGLLSRLTDAKSVLTTIAKGQKKLNFPIKINTCAVTTDEKRIMYERQFLRDIAKQNFSKYGIDTSDWYNLSESKYNISGAMFVITKRHSDRIIKTSCAIFDTLFNDEFIEDKIKFHRPILDYRTKDFIVSVTRPIRNYGVLGVNIFLNDLIEDVIYFNKFKDLYAFIIDINGTVIYHPAFLRSKTILTINFPVDISYLENSNTDFEKFRSRILNEIKGTVSQIDNNGINVVSYTWEQIFNTYVICVVNIGDKRPTIQINSWMPKDSYFYQSLSAGIDLLYQMPPQTLCRYFQRIATIDSETVFLSASSFQSPFAYLKNNKECKDQNCVHNSKSIMAYIKDITNLLANPGLQPTVRNDITALYNVMSYLKKRHQEAGIMKKYVIRRYLATINGVIMLYPGTVLETDFDPSTRPWFRKAIKFPQRTVITEPYLDAGGAGYIVTIAHTIFGGKANGLRDIKHPIAIVAIDVPQGFIYKMILESFTYCSDKKIKCILIENEGYVIAHPNILEPVINERNKRKPLGHITHQESFIANDMLNHKQLVQKKLCANYQTRKIQRYYTFNVSLGENLTNVYGEQIRYEIKSVSDTNVFAIILNTTYNDGAFCPCSTIDRACLNCNRMDQTDCECPCECTLKTLQMENKKSRFSNNNNTKNHSDDDWINKNRIPYCESPLESVDVFNSLNYEWKMTLKSCINVKCDSYLTQFDCLGVIGCVWCQLDSDEISFLTPFCTTQTSCFNGVLGSIPPYADGELGSFLIESTVPSTYSALGPVVGAVIALFLVVGFAIYCYRQNLDNIEEDQFYATDSLQETNFGLHFTSRFNFDDNLPHDDNDSSHRNNIRTNIHNNLTNRSINAISPYHIASNGCKRSNVESDHGYSTMTPREDSEHMSFTLIEPLIDNKKRYSISTDSVQTSNQDSSVTTVAATVLASENVMSSCIDNNELSCAKDEVLYNKCKTISQKEAAASCHNILVPVTVHRHMEAS